jgi:hypothetical protein
MWVCDPAEASPEVSHLSLKLPVGLKNEFFTAGSRLSNIASIHTAIKHIIQAASYPRALPPVLDALRGQAVADDASAGIALRRYPKSLILLIHIETV